MELYKKHRPKRLKQFIGNKEVTQGLQSKIDSGDLPHAILITGPTGTGKTTLGRILKTVLNCSGMDYTEIDSGIFRGIDTVRDLRKRMVFKPLESECKVILIDEVHQLGTGGASMKNPAQNALLKMLEDTPKHVYFILCTTDPQMLIKPIKGRCQHLELKPLRDKEMSVLLKRVCKKEKKDVPEEVIEQIIESAQGLPRNALQILDKIIDLPEDQMLESAKVQKEVTAQSYELCQALLKSDSWPKVSAILEGLKGQEAEGIRRHIIAFMSGVLLKGGLNPRAFSALDWFEDPLYDIGFPGLVLNCYRVIVGESDG